MFFVVLLGSISSVYAVYSSRYSSHKPETLNIGMSTALTGLAKDLGKGMQLGVKVYFDKINAEGGISGQKLKLITLDDGYEPERAALNMRELIDKDHVLAVIGNVGSPTAVVSVPIANQKKTLLFGAFTGSGILRRSPPDRYVINLRASYEEETAAMVNGLVAAGIKPSEIAFFTQNDSFGDSGYRGAIKALKNIGFFHPESLPHGRYTRNTLNVEEALATLIDADSAPRAIIMVASYQPAAKFIKLAKQEYPEALFVNVSFVGSAGLSAVLGKNTRHIIVTQVVPPLDVNLPAIAEYRRDLLKYGHGALPNFVSLEGYLAAKLFVLGIKDAVKKGKLDREGIIDVFNQLHHVDIGIGEKISFDAMHHQALSVVWPTILIDGQFKPFTWAELRNKTYNHEKN